MVDRASGETVRRSVILGGGGVPGAAWMAGLAAELRRRGIDLAAADSIVGTSAGAVVGAADDPRPPGSTQPPSVVKFELAATVFGLLFDRSRDRDAARREVGRLAMDRNSRAA
ncbi:patatin-like phospholipase family protein [Nocardia yamanashiensis]|uniref:patatin-like phospholipase family protein n=1 Tax=Nocardia yamanashiensis TaxID=209247 RepID=UPI001C3F5A24|nr:patatin-like phospholipase family protein [Nocardia yamanashiensis]